MAEPVSLLAVIREGGFDASIITTYNAVLPFYEEVVLRRLVAAECRQNIVLMDRRQCAVSWNSRATRPRLAGSAYSLVPVASPGAFHPKICLLIGKNKAALLVGSHNLTLSGFGINREITNLVQVNRTNDPAGTALVWHAWTVVHGWIRGEQGRLPPALLDAVTSVDRVFEAWRSSTASAALTLLHQSLNTRPLWEQLGNVVRGPVRRIVVMGAFFDRELALIEAIACRCPDAEVVVAIDPDTVHMPGRRRVRARFVDARRAWDGANRQDTYLHAKLVYVEAFDDGDVLVSGSANPSRQGWMGTREHGNTEAVLVRTGSEARGVALSLGLRHMHALPDLDDATLDAAVVRSLHAVDDAADDPAPRLLVGTVDATGEVVIVCPADLQVDRLEMRGAGDDVIEVRAILPLVDGTLRLVRPPKATLPVRSCFLFEGGRPVARAMIVYPQLLAAAPSNTARELRDALALADVSGDGIERLLAAVESAVFGSEAERETEAALRARRGGGYSVAPNQRPASLELPAPTVLATPQSRPRLAEATDMVTVIDILSRAISGSKSVAALCGLNEEELALVVEGTDDGDDADPDIPLGRLDDRHIAQQVLAKLAKLTDRILAKLQGANDTDTRECAALQLLAVLMLLRELMRIEQMPRWRLSRTLFVSRAERQRLLDGVVVRLFGGKRRLMDSLLSPGKNEFREVVALHGLLLWLAWSVDLPVPPAAFNPFGVLDQPEAQRAMVLFLELARPLQDDVSVQHEFTQHAVATHRHRPELLARADSWLQSVLAFSRHWTKNVSDAPRVRSGGCCWVGACTAPRLIVQVTGTVVGLWDEPQPYQIDAAWVLAIQPMEIKAG